MENYSILLALEIEHDYYRDKRCRGMEVRMDRERDRTVLNNKLVFRQVEVNRWLLLGETGDSDKEQEGRVRLVLRICVPGFTWFTDLPGFCPGMMFGIEILPGMSQVTIAGGGIDWRERGGVGQIGMLAMDLATGTELPREVNLKFYSRRLKWEYMFVSRDGKADRQLELTDVSGQLKFGDMEMSDFCGGPAWRCKTDGDVLLQEGYDYVLRLFEVKPMGRKLLCKSLEFPQLGRFVAEDAGVIRQVVYY